MSKRIPKIGWIILIALLCLSLAIVPSCTGEGGGGIPYKNDGVFIQDTIGRVDSLIRATPTTPLAVNSSIICMRGSWAMMAITPSSS